MPHDIHVSVVSHGHGQHVDRLLSDLAAIDSPESLQLTLTLNIPEQLEFPLESLPFPSRLLHNRQVAGFALNHNKAFHQAPQAAEAEFYVVLNPDIRLIGQANIFTALRDSLVVQREHGYALLGPKVVDEQGRLQETGRIFPDAGYILRKALRHEPDNPVEYIDGIARVDWVAGMCTIMHRSDFETIQGYDESYRLYYEDVDLCLRLRQAGLNCGLVDALQIQHLAQRQSRRNLQHLLWHSRSLMRFLGKRREWQARAH